MSEQHYFLPTTTGQISDSAFIQLQSFASSIGPKWIAGFYYYSKSQIRPSKDAAWIDQGSGIGLGSYKRSDISEIYYHHREEIDFVLQIPPDIWRLGQFGIIDIDPSAVGKFLMR